MLIIVQYHKSSYHYELMKKDLQNDKHKTRMSSNYRVHHMKAKI